MKLKINPSGWLVKPNSRVAKFVGIAAILVMLCNNMNAGETPADVPEISYDQIVAIRDAANQGDLEAMHQIGNCYASGNGLPQSNADAVVWYRKAADRGYAKSQNNLAVFYFSGKGVKKDSAEGLKWLIKAVNQGLPISQNNMGMRYKAGQGMPKDSAAGVKLLRMAADQGFAPAQRNLGASYYVGDGVPQDYTEALKWFRKSTGKDVAQVVNSQEAATVVDIKKTVEIQPKKSTTVMPGEKIPKISTSNGVIYTDVRVRSRTGDSVRISHSDGFATLFFNKLERSSAELLGVLDHEQEKSKSEKADVDKSKADFENSQLKSELKKFMRLALQEKELKDVADWALMAEIDKAYTVEKLKILFGRPPDYSSENFIHWSNICWNPIAEKMDDLVYTTESRSLSDGRNTVRYSQPVLKCGGQSVNAPEPSSHEPSSHEPSLHEPSLHEPSEKEPFVLPGGE